MEQMLKAKLDRILAADMPSNYDCSDSACESIVEDFDDLTISQHDEICELVE